MLGLLKGVLSYQGYLVYLMLLTLGLSISQIRPRRHADRRWFRERLVAPAWVICFYCLVHVPEVASTGNGLRYLAYLLSGRQDSVRDDRLEIRKLIEERRRQKEITNLAAIPSH